MEPVLFLIDPNNRELLSPYDLLTKNNNIPTASPFTVSLISVVVAEDYDNWFRGDNDVLVMSKSALGTNPLVERIHFYEEEIPKGRPIRNILSDTIFLTDDYAGEDKLWLELWILEVDTDTGERKNAIMGLQSLAATAGAVFPVAAPYTAAAGLVLPLIDKLISSLEKDEDILKIRMAFYPEARLGRAPLQEGTYVAFSRPVEPSTYKMKSSGLLEKKDKSPLDTSYAVFEVRPESRVSQDFVKSQKVATLLTQIKQGNDDTVRNTISFLQETISTYTNYKKLERYAELKGQSSRTPKEDALLKEIEKIPELKPFLPKV